MNNRYAKTQRQIQTKGSTVQAVYNTLAMTQHYCCKITLRYTNKHIRM